MAYNTQSPLSTTTFVSHTFQQSVYLLE